MARMELTVQDVPITGLADIVMTAVDAGLEHSFLNDGRTSLVVRNNDVSPKTTTVVATDDILGRAVDMTLATSADETGLSGFLPKLGWNQSTGLVHVDFSADTSLEVAAVRFK